MTPTSDNNGAPPPAQPAPGTDKGVPDPDVNTDTDHEDALVDEGNDESFPASDPPASHQFT